MSAAEAHTPTGIGAPAVRRGPTPRTVGLVAQAAFFASGFAALLYQMVWQRLLTFFGGADVYSVTLIVSAFMAGLGFGSMAGGWLADRLSLRGRLFAFAGAELAIGLFAAVSVPLLYDVLYVHLGPASLSRAATAAVLLATLLWPTFFMGTSLPLLAKALAAWSATETGPLAEQEGADSLAVRTGRAADAVASLYGWNTVGAALGSLVTVWVLVRQFGFRSTVEVGAALNVGCALAALILAWRPGDLRGAAPAGRADTAPPAGTALFSLSTWIVLYALSGFVALSLEIVWFRMLGVILKSNSFTFATLLALYLSGVGLGALWGRRFARRSRRPGGVFLLLQFAIPVYAVLSLAAFVFLVERVALLRFLAEYLAEFEPMELDAAVRAFQRFILTGGDVGPAARRLAVLFVSLYGLVPLALIGAPTLLMGASFPFLQKATQTDPIVLGRRVGWLQAANIAGATLGAGLTGLWLLHAMGTARTLQVLLVAGAGFLLLWWRAGERTRRRLVFLSCALVLLAGTLAVAPGPDALWARLRVSTPAENIVAEDGSGLSLLSLPEGSPYTHVFVNGLSQSELPYGGIHTVLGALPVLIHPQPETVAVIGLGSGDTLFAIGGSEHTRAIDCIEIVGPQLDTLRVLDRRRHYPALRALLADPRVRHTVTDGRAFIMRGGRYDVIEADALRPTSAYAGNLYSLEYFELIRRHLNPGGLGVTWQPTRRTHDTFVRAFPYVLGFGAVLLGSDRPIPFDPPAIERRLRSRFTKAYYERGGVDVAGLVEPLLARPTASYGPDDDRSRLVDVNTDLFPRDEYLHGTPFLAYGGRRPRK